MATKLEVRMSLYDKDELKKILAQKETWTREELEKTLAKMPERKPRFTSLSDEEVERLYTPLDVADLDYEKDLGMPGQYPFTRGVQPSMYRGRLWTMRQFAGFSAPEETNQRFRYLLEHGQTGLSVAFDFPTLMGYDSDHPKSRGEVGKCGVACSSLLDMEVIFDSIPLDRVTTSMTINGPAPVVFALYLACAEKKGIALERLGGTLQNDMYKEFIAQHAWVVPPRPAVKMVVDVMEFCAQKVPLWNSISISGYHIREAGATAGQELAFTLADGLGYVEEGIRRGMPVDVFAPRLSFFFDVHNDFFEEIAKFRAARRIWARMMKERFHAKDPKSWMLRTHAQTAGVSLTAQQPMNNIVRVTMQALAAILGGTQSLHTNSMDETLALPTEQAVTVALRTQQIIAEESGVANTADPLGGSYYVEALTNKLEAQALAYIKKIDDMGGILEAIEQGYPQREIGESAMRFQRQTDKKEKVIVGVNRYITDSALIPILKIDEEAEKRQKEKLAKLRKERDNARVKRALEGLREAAKNDQNTMPHLLEGARSYATLGEMCDVLREVYGTYQDPAYF
jgi:methylmalonyl-CoA mutase, N-terminal domain